MSRGMFNVMCLRVTARAGGRTARVSRGMHEEGGGGAQQSIGGWAAGTARDSMPGTGNVRRHAPCRRD